MPGLEAGWTVLLSIFMGMPLAVWIVAPVAIPTLSEARPMMGGTVSASAGIESAHCLVFKIIAYLAGWHCELEGESPEEHGHGHRGLE